MWLLILICGIMKSQSACPAVSVSPKNVTIPCNTCTTLVANVQGSRASTSYTVSQIPYNPFSYTSGNPIIVNQDDIWSGVINLPFCFEFFGNTYNQVVIGSNGIISFDLNYANGYCPWNLMGSTGIPDASLPFNSIMGPYHDIDPTFTGTIRWQLVGSAPCRALIVSYYQIPMYGSINSVNTTACPTTPPATHQIVIYETTNIIEVYVDNKPICYGWNNGLAIEGIQNSNGTQAYVVPGRNNTQWTAQGDAWRFTPSGTKQYTTVWYDAAGNVIGNGDTITVCPDSSTFYIAAVVNNSCAGQIMMLDTAFVNISSNLSLTVIPDSFLVEGCNTVYINLSVNGLQDSAYIHFVLSGDATPGQDCSSLPDSVLLTPSSTDTSFAISAFLDGVYEGPETLKVKTYAYLCKDTLMDSVTIIILDSSKINLTIAPDTTINCPCSPVQLSSSVWGGIPPYTITWSYSGSTFTGNTLTVSACSTTTVTAITTDSCGYHSNFDTITINVAPPPPISFSLPDTMVAKCWGDTLNISVSNVSGGMPPYSYVWSNFQTTPSITYISIGDWKLYVTVDDTCSTIPYAVDSVIIHNTYVPVNLNLPEEVLLECPQDTATLIATFWNGLQPYNVWWYLPSDTFTSTITDTINYGTDTISIPPPHDYPYVVFVLQDSCGRRVLDTVRVQIKQYPPLMLQAISQDSLCIGDTLKIEVYPEGGAGNYHYLFSVSPFEMYGNTILYIPTSTGIYEYITGVIDKCGNEAHSPVSVFIEECRPFVPNVITPNEDGFNDYLFIPYLHKFKKKKIVIFNRWGTKVFEEDPYSGKWKGTDQNGNQLPSGTYYYIFTYDKGELHGYVTILREKK